jgi:hypothetical protein
MLCQGYDKVLDLRDGDRVELRNARGTTLRLTRGTLWVTQEHDGRDIVLRAGDVWAVERQGLTLAQAQEGSTLCLAGKATGTAIPRGRGPGIGERIDAFFASLAARFDRRRIPYS